MRGNNKDDTNSSLFMRYVKSKLVKKIKQERIPK